MKKNYLNKMLMAFAMIFAVGMFAACSSSDDDNSKKETTGGGDTPATQVATSGTLYMYEVVLPEATNWADCGFSWTKSGNATKITTSANATTLDKLTNAKLVAAIKETIKYTDELVALLDSGKAVTDKAVVIVDSVSIKDSYSSNVNFTFALKSGFEDKGEEQCLTYGMSLCFIDNLGNIQYGVNDAECFAGLSQLSDFLKKITDSDNKWSVSVTKNAAGFALKTTGKK